MSLLHYLENEAGLVGTTLDGALRCVSPEVGRSGGELRGWNRYETVVSSTVLGAHRRAP